jgi:hypothetical protein
MLPSDPLHAVLSFLTFWNPKLGLGEQACFALGRAVQHLDILFMSYAVVKESCVEER